MEEKKKKLTDKEEALCQAYVNDPETRWNKKQSAIKAGYSANCASELAYETLRKPHVKERISELCKEMQKSNNELKIKVLEEYEKLAMKEEQDQIKIAGLNGLAKYLGMDKQTIEHTGQINMVKYDSDDGEL